MDNTPIHHSDVIKQLGKFVPLFYSCAYSPFLNPIEELFSLIKRNFKKSKVNQENFNILELIFSAVKKVERKYLEKFAAHAYSFIEAGIRGFKID